MGPEGQRQMGPGMGQGQGMGMAALNLTAEQQQQMRQIRRDLQREQWEAQGKLMEAREDLRDLWLAEERDPAAIGEAYARIAELQRPMIEARVEAANKMRAVLSDEQREALREMRASGMGMMGSGGMMGGPGMGMMGQGGMGGMGMMGPGGMMGGGMGSGMGMMGPGMGPMWMPGMEDMPVEP
ncbi:periplasmic heavy metal sensor [Ectothiorhodospiraceae bacterium 2226]|nr:periplasmic heavy metal sensor [Ectothiorhodospiraceae bacterium 2226]